MKPIEFHIQNLGGWQVAEIDAEKTAFPFNLQAIDATDPTATKTPFSTQISIPRTQINDAIFGHIWRADSTSFNFDPLTRVPFRLYVNSSLFQDGYLKLEEVTLKEYKIRLFGGLADFFNLLSEAKMKDLDFGDEFTHVVDAGTVEPLLQHERQVLNDSGHPISNYFAYGLTFSGAYDDFDPKQQYRSILGFPITKSEATWTDVNEGETVFANPELDEHKRAFFDGSTPVCGEYRSYYQRPIVKMQKLFQRAIDVARSSGWSVELDPYFFSDIANKYWSDTWVIMPRYKVNSELVESVFTPTKDDIRPEDAFSFILREGASASKLLQIPFDSPEAIVCLDTHIAEVEIPFKIRSRIPKRYTDESGRVHRVNFGILKNGFNLTALFRIGKDDFGLNIFSDSGEAGSLVTKPILSIRDENIGHLFPQYPAKPNNPEGYSYFEREENSTGGYGDTWFLRAKIVLPNYNICPAGMYLNMKASGDSSIFLNNYDGVYHENFEVQTDIPVEIEFQPDAKITIRRGVRKESGRSQSTITYKQVYTTDETCFDFVMSYCKAFGLMFEKDDQTKTVRIMSRNSFYGSRKVEDWSDKIDRNRDYSITPVPFDYKIGIMKWADGDSKYEESYKEKTSREYGSMRFDTGYQHGNETKEYFSKMVFGNCVIAQPYSQYFAGRSEQTNRDNKILPHLENDGKTAKNTLPIVFIGEIAVPISQGETRQFLISDDIPVMIETGFAWSNQRNENAHVLTSSYRRYHRKFTSPAGRDWSLNFGNPSAVYADDEAGDTVEDAGEATIYARCWRNFLKDRFSRDAKMLTCYMSLTTSDVQGVFRKFLVVDGALWIVSRITGFNPLSRVPVKVELLRVQNINNYTNSQNFE